MKKLDEIKGWSSEKISQRVFYILLGISAVVFLLFFFVGFDMPYWENPDFNEPLFTDVLLILMWILIILTVVVSCFSIVKAYRVDDKIEVVNGIAEKRIRRYTWLGLLIVLVLTFVLSSSSVMNVNGKDYSEWVWLKFSDMFIFTSAILLVVAIGSVIYGATRYIRKERK